MDQHKNGRPSVSGKENATILKSSRGSTSITADRAFTLVLPAAMAMPADQVKVIRLDASLASHNLMRGVDNVWRAVVGRPAPIAEATGEFFDNTHRIALALGFADAQVGSAGPSPELATLIPRVWQVRDQLLQVARGMVAVGILPADAVARIVAGHGKFDAASDCVQLVALFREHEGALRGRSPVGPELLAEAAQIGTRAMQILRPGGSTDRRKAAPIQQATHVRDRMFTLAEQAHDTLWRCGAVMFGKGTVDEHVPALGSRARSPRKFAPPVVTTVPA